VGQIKVPNPYDPTQFTIFRDWKKGGHGQTNLAKALAESVNTYFYAIGGGYGNQKGLGISGIEKYIKLFGIGDKTGVDINGEVGGVVPSPEWKKSNI
jgi:penicillin-binding protein 2